MIRHLRLIQLMAFVGLVTPTIVGCSGDEHPAPAPYEGSSTPEATGDATGGASGKSSNVSPTCENLQVRECKVELGAQGSVQNCFVGLQLCTEGKWGPCMEPSEIESALNK